MQDLPVDDRGYPVPWFVAWVGGKPDFRVIGAGKIEIAVHSGRCWICGEQLGRHLSFVIGPMCAINRTISEPPAHRDCATFAAIACPFLTLPQAKRRTANLPQDTQAPAGNGLLRNPGVVCVWNTDSYRRFDADNGKLFRIGPPTSTSWYAEGRAATHAEIMASIKSGMPQLLGLAEDQGRYAVLALKQSTREMLALLPEPEADLTVAVDSLTAPGA